MNYVNHSGGCPGADMMWENEGYRYGVETIAYSFQGHHHDSKNPKVLSYDELKEGFEHVLIANKAVKRHPQGQAPYIKNLLARNWYQVVNSDAVFAVGMFDNKGQVSGGTGWAVQMAIDNQKPVYFFNQPTNSWYFYWYTTLGHIPVKKDFGFAPTEIPILVQNFAGIGTRKLSIEGQRAIIQVYDHTFGKDTQK
jgi:hypothetical protein